MMYINDIQILWYFIIGVIGLGVGYFVNWCNNRMPEHEKVLSKDFCAYLKCGKPNYILMLVTAAMYISFLYFCGFSLNLFKFLLLGPMLLIAFCVDYKHYIIPNRLTLFMLEIGLIFTFIEGIININLAIDRFLGLVVGGGIFLIITLLGGLIAGKEAMGLGDVKLMGALGLFLGWRAMILVSLISFLLGAVISIILLVTKVKKKDEYIPFGPFIVLATFVVMYIPFQYIIFTLMKVFTLGMY